MRMKISERYNETYHYRKPQGVLDGAGVYRWYRRINGQEYRFTCVQWDDGTWGALSRKLGAQPNDLSPLHFIDSEELT